MLAVRPSEVHQEKAGDHQKVFDIHWARCENLVRYMLAIVTVVVNTAVVRRGALADQEIAEQRKGSCLAAEDMPCLDGNRKDHEHDLVE